MFTLVIMTTNESGAVGAKTQFPVVTVAGRSAALALAVFLADSGYAVSTSRVRTIGGLVLPSDATLAERRAYDTAGRFEVSFYAAAEVSR